MNPHTGAELALLIRSAFPKRGRDEPNAAVSDALDWDRLLSLGAAHGVTPTVYEGLRSIPDVEPPPEIDDRFRGYVRMNATRALGYARELIEIGRSFDAAAVRWLPFKGPVLSSFAYGDCSRREFSDLDVLIHRDDFTAAVDALETRGYSLEPPMARMDDSAALGGPFTMPILDEYSLENGTQTVELRWRVGDADRPFTPGFETLWERRTTVDLCGATVPAFDPIDRLLMLAFHGTKHQWHLLKWVCDFAAAIVRTDLKWGELFRRARIHNLERRVLIGVALVTSIGGVDVPTHLLRRLETDSRAASLAATAETKLLSGMPTRPGAIDRLRYNVYASDTITEQLRMVMKAGPLHPSSPEYRLLPLPGVFHPAYYLVRPGRLLIGAVADRR